MSDNAPLAKPSASAMGDSGCWADEDEENDEPLPSVTDLRHKLETRRRDRTETRDGDTGMQAAHARALPC